MQQLMEKQINQKLETISEEIKHVRVDVDLLKGFILEDSVLTREEKAHMEKTIESFRKGKMDEFVELGNV